MKAPEHCDGTSKLKIKTYEDKHCDPAARFTAEVFVDPRSDYLKQLTDRSVTELSISVFAPTRAQAVAKLKAGIRHLTQELLEVVQPT